MTHQALILAASSDTATGVGIPLALAAGFVSFLSPCVLPLVPGYLSTVIGVTPNDLKAGVGARRVLVPSLLFIASFSLIFILLGLSATVIGSTLNEHKVLLERVGGVVIILLGIAFLASPFVRVLNFQWHSESLMRFAGRGGPLVAGAAFAIAWTPCTSITLGAILTQAAIFELGRARRAAARVLLGRARDPVPADRARVRADDRCARRRQAALSGHHRDRRRGDDRAGRVDPDGRVHRAQRAGQHLVAGDGAGRFGGLSDLSRALYDVRRANDEVTVFL